MSNGSRYVVAVNGKGSAVYGGRTTDGNRPMALPLRHKDAEELAASWPVPGQVIIYKLVPVKILWHEPPPVKEQ